MSGPLWSSDGSAISLPMTSRITAPERAGDPAEQPFEHERAAHEPVRRADELHDLDLTTAREDRQADRVRDQQRRCHKQEEDRDDEEDLDHVRKLEHAVRRLLAVVDLVDPDRRARLEERGDLLDVLAALGDDRQRVREAGWSGAQRPPRGASAS